MHSCTTVMARCWMCSCISQSQSRPEVWAASRSGGWEVVRMFSGGFRRATKENYHLPCRAFARLPARCGQAVLWQSKKNGTKVKQHLRENYQENY